MRDALNNNPMVQIGVLAALLVIVGFLFMTRMGGGAEPADSTAASAVAVDSGSAGSTDSVTGGTPEASLSTGATGGAAAVPPATSATPSVPAPPISPEALKPGPGLPAPVADAIKSGDSVVLLIVDEKAVDDRLVEGTVSTLSGRSGLEIFVVPAGDIADYSRVTQTVGVNRVPALVVVRPRAGGGKAPEAFVSYGFRKAGSVIQAVDDALYTGKENLPYHPG